MWDYLYPMRWRVNFTQALLISGTMHLLLILLLPGFTVEQLISGKPYIEVSLLPPPAVKIKKYAPPAPAKRKPKAVKWRALAPRLAAGNKRRQIKSELPLVKLPPTVVNKQDVINLLPEAAFSIDELLKVPAVDRSLSQAAEQVTVSGVESPAKPTSNEISWAGLPRRYLYRPPNPSYSSRIEGEVKLKFWVDPQGNVTNAIVLKRLDAKLERLAIDYVKGWRFEPLKGRERELQWGTISIKFRWSEADKHSGNTSQLNRQ